MFEEQRESLTDLELAEYFKKLSGKDVFGVNSSFLSYQSYLAKEDGGRYTLSVKNGEVTVYQDSLNPGYIFLSIRFRSKDDEELLLLWRNLEKFRKGLTESADKDPVFYVDITKVLEPEKEVTDVYSVHMVNPVLFCISKADPAEEDGQVPGTVAKLVFTADNFELEVTKNANFLDEKSEVLRELDNEPYEEENDGEF